MFDGFQPFDIAVSKQPLVNIHGIRSGNGPPLLLLHGYPQTHVIWNKITPSLTSHFTVIALDLRGYGASSKPPVDTPDDHSLYAKSAMAADCAAVMKELGFKEYFVLGHDRGARVAHKLCVDYPKQVKKAMLLDICSTLAMFEATDQLLATAYWHWFFLIQPKPFPETVILSNPQAFAQKQLAALGMGAGQEVFGQEAWDVYKKQLEDPEAVHAMCEDYRAAAKEDLEEQRKDIEAGKKIQCPIRVLWGKSGLIEKKFDAVKEWKKVAEKGVVDPKSMALDCGHYIPEEAPDQLLEHVFEFFK